MLPGYEQNTKEEGYKGGMEDGGREERKMEERKITVWKLEERRQGVYGDCLVVLFTSQVSPKQKSLATTSLQGSL